MSRFAFAPMLRAYGLLCWFAADMKLWIKDRGLWWLTSVVAHAVIISTTLLLLGDTTPTPYDNPAPSFVSSIDNVIPEPEIESLAIADRGIDAIELEQPPLSIAPADTPVDASAMGDPALEATNPGEQNSTNILPGGDFPSRGFKGIDHGPKSVGPGDASPGRPGSGSGPGSGPPTFVHRGPRGAIGISGKTAGGERAVGHALEWLARHQNSDGSWSLGEYSQRCTDATCSGAGSARNDIAATSLALLPFLARGYTHASAGPYKAKIGQGLYWLMQKKKADGDLSGGTMYAQGLATIALCEAYGMTRDKRLGGPAQQALNFIVAAQDPLGGGWRYTPRMPGDTSVVGWQIMALKSGQMAGLSVPSPVLEKAQRFLNSVASGQGEKFGYLASAGPSPTMSAVGLLCTQYLGARREAPALRAGIGYLSANPPNAASRNCYYWYYATQVMHNVPGPEWDQWNRAMRRILVDSQVPKGCAAGSWNPAGHGHGEQGGRIMVTSLNCLTLEVYYRYLPLYQLDGGAKGGLGKSVAE